jgi:hypothetical protein
MLITVAYIGMRWSEVIGLPPECVHDDQVDIAQVPKSERMGHEVADMRGVYSHVSDGMRAEPTMALQERWAASLVNEPGWRRAQSCRSWTLCWWRSCRSQVKIRAPKRTPREGIRCPITERCSVTCGFLCGRYWDRTSDLLGVNERQEVNKGHSGMSESRCLVIVDT